MIKKLAEITTPISSSLKLSQTNDTGLFPVYGASGVCGFLDTYQVEDDSVVIVKDGAGIGRVHYMSGKSSALGTMQIISPTKSVKAKFLFYLMKFLNLGKSFNGTTIPHIYYKDYSKISVKVYDIDKQNRVINVLDDISSMINTKENEILFLDELIKSRFIGQEVCA